MSRKARIGLVVAAVIVAVAGFAIASPGDEDDTGDGAAQPAPQAETARSGETAPPEPEPEPEPEPDVTRIRLRGGEVVGGPPDVSVQSGDVVRIVVSSDGPDEIHLHGYDVTRETAPGRPARLRVEANLEGSFELESHVAEDAGRDPLVARLNVEPR